MLNNKNSSIQLARLNMTRISVGLNSHQEDYLKNHFPSAAMEQEFLVNTEIWKAIPR